MKKLITSASLLLLSYATFGQGLTSKKGHAILPEAKDWSISFDAVPFLDYAFDKTRIFSNTLPSSAASALNFQTPMTIVGKYMIRHLHTFGKILFGRIRIVHLSLFVCIFANDISASF